MVEIPPQSELVRGWLETQDGPRTVPEIADAIGQAGNRKVGPNVHRMFREGVLSREGRCRQYAFQVARDIRRPLDPEERQRRRTERERARRRRNGKPGRTWAEWQAECAAKRAATKAREEAAKAERAAAREAERLQREARRQAARRKREAEREARKVKRCAPPRNPRAFRIVKPAPDPAPRVNSPAESVDDFLRRGGKITRLEPFAVSKPLRIAEELRVA